MYYFCELIWHFVLGITPQVFHQYLSKNVHIEWFSPPDSFLTKWVERRHILLDISSESSNSFLRAASSRKLFNASNHWIIYGASLDKISENLQSLDINYDTQITILVANVTETLVYRAWRSSVQRNIKLEIASATKLELSNIKKRNLEGILMSVATNVSVEKYKELLLWTIIVHGKSNYVTNRNLRTPNI